MDTEFFIPPAAFHVGTQFQLLIVFLLMPPIQRIFLQHILGLVYTHELCATASSYN